MLNLLKLILLFLAWSGVALSQDGLGQLNVNGKSKYRPTKIEGLDHPSGTVVWKFTLPGASCNGVDCSTDRERIQLIQSKPDSYEGHTYTYTFSFLLPNDYPDVSPTNTMFWEVKPFSGKKPSVSVAVIEGHLQFDLSDPYNIQNSPMRPIKPLIIKNLGKIPRGRWVDFVITARWSRSEDGFIKVNYNGKTVVNYKGRTIDSVSESQGVMFGIYRSFISRYKSKTGVDVLPTQEVYFANMSKKRIE